MRLIDADALKEVMCRSAVDTREKIGNIIDNAPTVEIGYLTNCSNCERVEKIRAKNRPQGEWYENIPKDCLKARHGDYVIYKVDFLLDNLAREVNIMEGARKMRGNKE